MAVPGSFPDVLPDVVVPEVPPVVPGLDSMYMFSLLTPMASRSFAAAWAAAASGKTAMIVDCCVGVISTPISVLAAIFFGLSGTFLSGNLTRAQQCLPW